RDRRGCRGRAARERSRVGRSCGGEVTMLGNAIQRCLIAMFVLAAGCHTAPAVIEEPPAPELALALEADPAHPKLPGDGRPVADEEIGRLLDWRVALPRRARIAMIEMRAF